MEEELKEKGVAMTYEDCETEMGAIKTAAIQETELFINGDHWQKQAGWIGWRPESTSESALATWRFIETGFCVKNVIGGVVHRLKGAIAGQQPDFALLPKKGTEATDEEKNTFKAMDAALNEWFTRKDVHEQIKKYVHNRTAHGKACLRIHIPIGLLQKNGDSYRVNATTFEQALDYIYITAHDADKFIDGEDVTFGEKYSIVKLDGNVNPSDANTTKQYQYELSFVNKEKQTVIRTVNQDKSRDVTKTLNLGGNPLVMVKGKYTDAMITTPIKTMQKAVNHAKTGENLALSNINFPETTFIDLELPQKSVLQPNGKSKMVDHVPTGAGVFRKLLSRITTDAEGGERVAQGQVITREQADPEKFARVAANNTRDIHQSLGMLYIYLGDSEYASGDAKIESMSDYLILLIDNKTELDVVGTWLGNTVTRLALYFAKLEKLIEQFTFVFSSKLTLGKLTVEERKLMLEEIKMLLRSRRSYRVLAGVSDDPDKEEIAILDEIANLSDEFKELAYGLKRELLAKTGEGSIPSNQPQS